MRVLDTGVAGIPYVTLDQTTPAAWVHDLDPGLGLTGDPCTSFYPGVADAAPTSACDCNGNNIRDKCDIESSFSLDCNGNAIPDTCDVDNLTSLDCNNNDVPDECEPDCNGNLVADGCDISGGASTDANANTIPDECERGVLAPRADALTKNRYISFRPGGPSDGSPGAVIQAIRVTAPSVPGFKKWVGLPDENGISRLQCTPEYRSWGFGMLHVADADITPNRTYVVQGIKEFALITNEVAFSDPPTSISTTTKFGDLVDPIGNVNFQDIAALVDAFQNRPGAPPRTVADLYPAIPDYLINFLDIALDVTAFQLKPYPYGDPTNCP